MASKYLQKYPVPQNFQEILHDFTREIIRDQPDDILLYCCNYFEALNEGRTFSYDSKFNIKRADQKNPKEYPGGAGGNKMSNSGAQSKVAPKGAANQTKSTAQASHQTQKPVDAGSNKRMSNPKVGEKAVPANGGKKPSKEIERLDSNTSHRTEKSMTKNYVGELYNSALKHVPKDTDDSEEQVVLDGPIEEYEKAATFIQKKWKDHKEGGNAKNEKKPKRPKSAEAKKKSQEEEVILDGPIEEYEKAATTIQAKWKSRQAAKEEGAKPKKAKKERPLSSDTKKVKPKEEVVLEGPIEDYEKAALKIQHKWKENQGGREAKKNKKESEDEEMTITRNLIETNGHQKQDSKTQVELDGPIEEYEKAATTIQARWKEKKEEKSGKNKDEIRGQLLVNLISAKNLLPESDEDIETFCLAFMSHKPENIMKTDNVVTTHNPQWRHKDKVYNLDQGKTLIGEVEIKLKNILENPGTWIDESFLLNDIEGDKTADSYVYVQACWQPDGLADEDIIWPEIPENY